MRIETSGVAWSTRERLRRWYFHWATWLTAGALLTFALSAVLMSGPRSIVAAVGPLPLAVVGALLLLWVAVGRRRRSKRHPGVIEIYEDWIVVRSAGVERRVSLEDIEQGWMVDGASPRGAEVFLQRRGGVEIVVAVRDHEEGKRVLQAVGVSTVHRVLRVPLRSEASLRRGRPASLAAGLFLLLSVLVFCVTAGGLHLGVLLAMLEDRETIELSAWHAVRTTVLVGSVPVLLLGLRRLLRRLRPREAIVGSDGVAIAGFRQRLFFPYASIAEVVRDRRGVELHMRGGGRVLLPTAVDARAPLPIIAGPAPAPDSAPADALHGDVARREALFQRIQEAMASRRVSRASHAQLEQLERGRSSVAQWRRRLLGLFGAGEEGRGYRGTPLGIDTLAEIVEDASASPERRVAATVVLASTDDERLRARVRMVVEACADEELRAALEQAAEGEIDATAVERLAHERREGS